MNITEYTQYILWGGGALIALVVLHGLWINLRGRLARRSRGQTLDRPPAEQMSMEFDAETGADVQDDYRDQGAGIDIPAGGDEGLQTAGPQPEAVRHGRRIPVAGRRTEPTVPRGDRDYQNGRDAYASPTWSDKHGPPDDIGDVIVIWILAKSGTFNGQELLRTLTDNELTYSENVFHKLDPNTRQQRFTVANGVEPGTFDLSDADSLATPRLVFLLRLGALLDPMPAFEDMLDVAQNVAGTLGGDLKDEQTNDLSGQTVEHCRQRIRDFRRINLRA